MQRLYLSLCLLILASLLVGCAPQAGTHLAEVRALENHTPTSLPESSSTPEITKSEVVPHDPPANCPVTLPQEPHFRAPEPYSPDAPWDGNFWYGSNQLWVALRTDGVWWGLPDNPTGYTQKIPWWREGYVWNEEPQPKLIVTGERLDGKAPPLKASGANGAYAADMGSAMMMGVDFPTLGCWKITGQYQQAELSFVVWVAP